jgi:enoyl-CoA hydratase/carnithine racemase
VNPGVVLERSGAIATITLDRPRRKNALGSEDWQLLHDALRQVTDPGVRAVVLTGAGGDFCAGADISETSPGLHPLERLRRISDVVVALHELAKPVVAKVDGVAVGAGWNLALACDLVVATPRARFSQIFARRGLSLDCGGSWLLPRLVGAQTAKRLAYLAEIISGTEAHQLGLVTRLVEPELLDKAVGELAAELAAGPPIALAQNKFLLQQAETYSLREAVRAENAAQVINFATDAPAARAAGKGERPQFTGGWRG